MHDNAIITELEQMLMDFERYREQSDFKMQTHEKKLRHLIKTMNDDINNMLVESEKDYKRRNHAKDTNGS